MVSLIPQYEAVTPFQNPRIPCKKMYFKALHFVTYIVLEISFLGLNAFTDTITQEARGHILDFFPLTRSFTS